MTTSTILPKKQGPLNQQITGVNIEGANAENINISGVSIQVEADNRPEAGDAPFKGLQFFDVTDASIFFGREELTAELVTHLRENPFLAVVGASGSGKSSAIRAGVIPCLKGATDCTISATPPLGSETWPVVIITPTAQPLESLARGLADQTQLETNAANIYERLLQSGSALRDYAQQLRGNGNLTGSRNRRLLLVIDQFEELFTQAHSETSDERIQLQRSAFVHNLLACLLPENQLTVIITLRADFYAHCAEFADLRTALEKFQKYIGPMSESELRQAIEEPAHQGNWDLEPGLTDLILQDAGREPGALPLLSHALLETWKRRKGRQLTLNGYTESGRVQAAIANSAESIFNNKLNPEQQAIARDIFVRLTELGEGAEDTRRRVDFAELLRSASAEESVTEVVQALADSRLITTDDDDGNLNPHDDDIVVEVAHEALIREWPRLRGWLDEDREGIRTHRRLTKAAQEWDEYDHNDDMLFRGIRLDQTLEWLETHAEPLSGLEKDFLDASAAAVAAKVAAQEEARRRELEQAKKLAEEQRRRAELRGKTTRRLAVALLVALAALGVGYWSLRISAAEQNGLQANNVADANLDTGLLIATEAYNQQWGSQTEVEGSLLSTVQCCSQQLQGFLTGHTDRVWSVDFNHDGSLLASGSDDGTVRVWDVESRQPIKVITTVQESELSGTVYSVDFSPDGKYLVSGSGNRQIIVYDTQSWTMVGQPMVGHTGNVHDVEFSPDGTKIASGGADNRVILWDTISQSKIRELHHGPSHLWIWDVEFTPDGNTLASTGWDKQVRLWDLRLPLTMTLKLDHTGTSLGFLEQDGELVLASGRTNGNIRFWDMTDWQRKRLPAFDDDSTRPLTNRRLWFYYGHIWTIAVNPANPSVFAVGTGNVTNSARGRIVGIERINASDGVDKMRIENVSNGLKAHSRGVFGVAFSPNGKLVAAGSQDNLISLWNVDEGDRIVRHEDHIFNLTLTKNAETIFASSPNGEITKWDHTGNEVETVKFPVDKLGAHQVFHPDGDIMLSNEPEQSEIALWDLENKMLQKVFSDYPAIVSNLAFSPDGDNFASGHQDGSIVYWHLEEGMVHPPMRGNPGKVAALAFHPYKPILASGQCSYLASDGTSECGRGEVRLWDLVTGKQIGDAIDGKSGLVRSVTFSPDGENLAIGSHDKMLTVWSMESERELYSFPAHTKSIRTVAFSPNGQWLVTGSEDATVRLWDAKTGQAYGRAFRDHNKTIVDLAFDADGGFLYSASTDNTIIAHDLRPKVWQERACRLAGRSLTDQEKERYLDRVTRYLNRFLYGDACPA